MTLLYDAALEPGGGRLAGGDQRDESADLQVQRPACPAGVSRRRPWPWWPEAGGTDPFSLCRRALLRACQAVGDRGEISSGRIPVPKSHSAQFL